MRYSIELPVQETENGAAFEMNIVLHVPATGMGYEMRDAKGRIWFRRCYKQVFRPNVYSLRWFPINGHARVVRGTVWVTSENGLDVRDVLDEE